MGSAKGRKKEVCELQLCAAPVAPPTPDCLWHRCCNWSVERRRRRRRKFLPARRYMLARVFATATCLSVRPSVCLSGLPSHAGIVPSRAKAGSWSVHCLIVSGKVWFIEKFARGHPKGTCQMRVGWVFSAIFDQYVVISRKRCILDTKLLWGGNRKPCKLSNGVTFDDLEWPMTRVSRSR